MGSVEEAKKNVIEWLKHPNELGKEPQAVEYVKSFQDEEGMDCMIFKYRKGRLSPWLLAIASEAGIFSHMEKFEEATAEKDANDLLQSLKNFWKNKAAEAQEREERAKGAGRFIAFVLLKDPVWDHEQFEKEFASEWGLKLSAPKTDDEKNPTLVYSVENGDAGIFLAVGLIDRPIPDGEAEFHAQFNYMWKDAVAITKTHQAHMIVTVMGAPNPMEAGVLFAKALTTFCRSGNTLGVYYNDVVAEPRFLVDASALIKQNQFPMLSLIWFGLGRSEHGVSAYTCGLTKFGRDDMEIVDSSASPAELRSMLLDFTAYVIGADVILHDGETIGFTNEQRLKIVRSKGVNVSGDSLKILI
ncbi:MAG: DUF4261 domain-containing protein [Lachnospiraceae bacterium]|nr:DUF4261 domain-containing protein [Lachnospiraceae bacterium]